MTAWIVVGVLALLGAMFAWGFVRLRRGQTQAFAAALSVRIEQVPSLVEECIAGFGRLGEQLDPDDAQATAALLDRYVSSNGSVRLKSTFARPDAPWHFALPVGAVLGELLCRHAGGAWAPAEGGGLCVLLPVEGGHATAHPFEKVIKHAVLGKPGDLATYLSAARGFKYAMPAPETADA